MNEVLQIHLGQAGANIALQSWELLAEEHGFSLHGPFPGLLPPLAS